MKNNNTITAIATPNINCAISIIRVSGTNAYDIISKLCKKQIEKKGFSFCREFIYENNEVVDDVILLRYVSPRSFTGEDLIEINCHGGILVTNKILNLIIANGARLAEPGEFTKRAFLNNKLTLRQANSINNLIFSKTESSLKLSANGIVNKNNEFFYNIKEQLFFLIGKIEVNIDYPEYEDVEVVTKDLFLKTVSDIYLKICETITQYNKVSYLYNGIKIAIVGKPNVGKSSLLNCLLKKDKAIVSNIQGTTRDIVNDSVVIDGLLLNFFDTAGIRQAKNSIEKIGIKKTFKLLNEVDLVLFLIDGVKKMDDENKKLFNKIKKQKQTILVKNKCDLKTDVNKDLKAVNISCKNNNIEKLIEEIKGVFKSNNFDVAANLSICSENELNQIQEIKTILENSIKNAKKNQPLDLLVVDLTYVYKKICLMLGLQKDLDIIDKMFKNFCLGK